MHLAKAVLVVCAGLLCLATTHTPAAAELELDSGLIPNGGVYEHTFMVAGAYPYHCVLHVGMQGAVNVVAGGPPTASVTIVNNAFIPESVTVAPGGTVTWTNTGTTHTVTSIPPTPTKSTTWGRIKTLYR